MAERSRKTSVPVTALERMVHFEGRIERRSSGNWGEEALGALREWAGQGSTASVSGSASKYFHSTKIRSTGPK